MNITACIITKNEEANLRRCLRGIQRVADEIIVVDSGSTDATCDIAREFGARVIHHEWEGYVGQKNFAMSRASHEWVLSLDADEELSEKLIEEIMQIKRRLPSADGFLISRVVFFENEWIRFGDWYPDYLIRLFKKEKGAFAGGSVHERLEFSGSVEKLKHEIIHHTYQNRADQLHRIQRYAELWAKDAFANGKPCRMWTAWFHAGWRLFRGLILKSGWRGGRLGWQIAQANAYEVLLKYQNLAKLYGRS